MGDIMKRIIMFCIVLVVVFNISGCKKAEKKNELDVVVTNNTDNLNIDVNMGVFQYWNEIEFPITKDCVPDHTTAIDVTRSIVSGFQKDGMYPKYSPQSVFFDTEKQLWIVTFYPNDNQEGACLNIAIKKDDAQVVKMWVQD